MIENILNDGLIKGDKNLLDSSFETIRANRRLVAHENSSLNVTLEELENSFNICKRAFEIILDNI